MTGYRVPGKPIRKKGGVYHRSYGEIQRRWGRGLQSEDTVDSIARLGKDFLGTCDRFETLVVAGSIADIFNPM